MNIAETIQCRLNEMTRSERQVAGCYLAHMQEFAFQTLEGVANLAETSTTSVLRFCRRLGYEGFKEFQQALRMQLRFQPALPDKYQRTVKSGTDDALLSHTVSQTVRCIHDTFRALPSEVLEEAVECLRTARQICTFGMKESNALAHYAYTRLLTVRPEVHLLSGPGNGEYEQLLRLGKEDVCVAFLFHRYSYQSVQVLELLKERGVAVILVTNEPCTQVENLAQVLILCQVDHGGIKNTAVAPVVLMDYLCGALAVAMGEEALRHMERSEELFRLAGTVRGER